MVKFHSYLAGSAFALLLCAHIAMELLHVYPANQYLWHVNIAFAREVRPLLQHIDTLAGGSFAITILSLATLALLCTVAARTDMRVLAIANCHIALCLFIVLAAKSYDRTYPRGLPATDRLASLATELSVVQFGIIAFLLVLTTVCVQYHVEVLGRGFRRLVRQPTAQPVASNRFWPLLRMRLRPDGA